MSNFFLSKRSLGKLVGVDKGVVECVKVAITLTKVDFGAIEGLRSLKKQKEYYNAGKSHTMKSKHLTGEAVDLVAYVGRSISWELLLYDEIAEAMRAAAKKVGIGLRWGGAWSCADITKVDASMAELQKRYIASRVAIGKRPFIDAPHFEKTSPTS